MVRGLLLCTLATGAAATVAPDAGFEGLFKDNLDEVWPEQCFTIPNLPSYVSGTYVTQSAAQFSMGGKAFQAWLDAYFKLHTVELGDGKACYKSKIIRTDFYNNSVKLGVPAGGVFFMETEPPRECKLAGLCNLFGANDNNFAASYRIKNADGSFRYALMTDTELHLDFDVNSLDVIGKRKFTGHFAQPLHMVKGGGTHLQCEAGKGQSQSDCDGLLYGVTFEQGMTTSMDLYRLRHGAPDVRELVSRIKVDSTPGSMHSFGLTDDFAILPMQPFTIDSLEMMKGKDIMHSIKNTGTSTPIHLVNLTDGTVRTFNFSKALYYVHMVNSWQNATHVSFDVSAFEKQPFSLDDPAMVLGVLLNKTARDAADNVETIRRYTLDLATSEVGEEFITDGPSFIDFPKIRSDKYGRPYCIYYGVEWKHNGANYGSWALRKHDICKGTVQHYYEPGNYLAEAQFVASGAPQEDAGVLLSVRTSGVTNTSSFIVLDAQNISRVIEEFQLPHFVGWWGHGAWFPGERDGSRAVVPEVVV